MADGNFFQKLFSSFFGSSDPAAEKKRQLKAIAKQVGKSKYKFYKTSSGEVLASFAKYFYDIYKAISQAQALFLNTQNKEIFKRWVVDYYLTDKQRESIENLSEESIIENAKTLSFDEITSKIKVDIEVLSNFFSQENVTKTDSLYTRLMAFSGFVSYDYYFLLKKFASSLKERDFSAPPRFDNINAEYITDDLKEFVTVVYAIPLDNLLWSDLFEMLKQNRGVSPISPAVWNKILARIKDIRNSGILEMLIQLCAQDPNYRITETIRTDRIAEPFFDKIKDTAEKTIKKLEKQQKDGKKSQLVSQIFGTETVVRLKYYTENNGIAFTKKRLSGYKYAAPLNYLKAFLIDYIKKDLREFCDLVLVRGKWATTALSTPLSDSYNSLLETSDVITNFDNQLSEDGEYGTKFKNYIIRVDRDIEAQKVMTSLLEDVNSDAKELITESAKRLISVGKTIKALLEDHEKQRPEMLINWKELDRFAEVPIKDLGVDLYKRIYLFVSLMQMYIQ